MHRHSSKDGARSGRMPSRWSRVKLTPARVCITYVPWCTWQHERGRKLYPAPAARHTAAPGSLFGRVTMHARTTIPSTHPWPAFAKGARARAVYAQAFTVTALRMVLCTNAHRQSLQCTLRVPRATIPRHEGGTCRLQRGFPSNRSTLEDLKFLPRPTKSKRLYVLYAQQLRDMCTSGLRCMKSCE